MTKHRKVGVSVATASLLSLAVMTLGMPMLVLAGWGGSSDPLGGRAGLNTEGLPPAAAAAYEAAADAARRFEPPCELPAWLLAGVGEIESGHGTSGGATIRSEEHTSELQSLMRISYAVFCLKQTNTTNKAHKQ